MQRSTVLLVAAALATLAGCARPSSGPAPQEQRTLQAFRSDAEYLRFYGRLVRQYERAMQDAPPPPPPPPPPPSPSSPPAGAPSSAPALQLEQMTAAGAESVTNVQHAGVDEGGIVKVHGDHLVVLRRGRLFTVRIGGDAMQPVAVIDAFAPGTDGDGWYDEMLVSGDDVVVIGFDYDHGTEIGLFRIGADGSLAHRATYHVRSDDYYSGRGYASRLIGKRLIIYNSLELDPENRRATESFPAVRRWGGADTTFQRTASARRIYRPAGPLSGKDEPVLHTVTSCTIREDSLDCESTALFGPQGEEFYVSPTAVYVWATRWPRWDSDDYAPLGSVLYRVPLDGSAPTGIRVDGAPVDALSFLESADGHVNVLVSADGQDASLWNPEPADGPLALLRLPISAMGDGSGAPPASAWRPLPAARGSALRNRFLGDWLLYGSGMSRDSGELFAVRWAGGGEAARIPLPHGVERIESMGSGAVVVGTGGGELHFSGFRLEADGVRFADRYTHPAARQGESRSHGFFYRADDDSAGVLGLPVRRAGALRSSFLETGSAAILFLRNADYRLAEIGRLDAGAPEYADDGCVASCVDWYGNARPLFLRGRIFALMGYELVEGMEDDGRIVERRRATFAPPPLTQLLPGEWTFTETIGGDRARHRCRNEGTMQFIRDGDTLSMSYRQTGSCTTDGVTRGSDSRGSGTGRTGFRSFHFDAGGCRYSGMMTGPDRVHGTSHCTVEVSPGDNEKVFGAWEARREGT